MPSNRIFVRAFMLLSATTVLPACAAAQNDESSSSSSSLSTFCSTLCDRVNACDNQSDVQTCNDGCKNENAAAFPKLRGDLVHAIEGCIGDRDCKTVLSTDVVSVCSKEALASLAPSDEGMHLCDDVAAMTSCVATDRAKCLESVKVFNDDVLREADACTQKSCSQFKDCFEAALDITWGSGSSSSGTPSPAPDAGSTCASAVSWDDAACNACGHMNCCADAAACLESPDCTEEANCRRSCMGDDLCMQDCAKAYFGGDYLLQTWSSCLRGACGDACGL